MRVALQEFGALLRRGGVRISSAELLDALRAAECVGLADRARLKAALETTLVKRSADLDSFNELFELYFGGGMALWHLAGESPLGAWIAEREMSDAEQKRLLDALAAELAEMSAMGRIAMGARVPEIPSLVASGGMRAELANIRSPLQVGYYSYRVLGELGMSEGVAQATDAIRRLATAFPDAGLFDLEGVVEENVRDLRNAIREYVDGRFRQQNPSFHSELAARSLADKPLASFTPADVAAARSEIRRLARLLRARLSARKKRKRRGSLDAGRTLRASLATEGVPFQLRLRERPRRRPRVVVLCDVSDSVRNVSLFMLQFLYLLQEFFDGVRTFAFVAELADLTPLFKKQSLDRSLSQVLSGEAVNVFANSDYGRVLEQFHQRHAGLLGRRTTAVVIGDGRNNYHDSRADLLRTIQMRSRSVIWINSEAKAAWGFGDSAMHEYAEHCDRVAVAHNLRSLRKVIDDLLEGMER